ncbi:hypothetical protein Mapa_011474 [Marchantia paleacea]|nr:hypothetical protein Mapa_011474 [Marchantia paleacea]
MRSLPTNTILGSTPSGPFPQDRRRSSSSICDEIVFNACPVIADRLRPEASRGRILHSGWNKCLSLPADSSLTRSLEIQLSPGATRSLETAVESSVPSFANSARAFSHVHNTAVFFSLSSRG